MSNYPAGVSDRDFYDEEETYVFEVHGAFDIEVEAYSEDEAKNVVHDNLMDYIYEAIDRGDIEIR